MNNRLKVFGIIAVLGFFAGIIAQLTASVIIPWFAEAVMPLLGTVAVSYLISGVAGACITVVLVSAWAYFTGKKDQPY